MRAFFFYMYRPRAESLKVFLSASPLKVYMPYSVKVGFPL